MVMEMYCGDLAVVLAEISRSRRPKSVIILTNMFTPAQQVYFLPFARAGDIEFATRIKGLFTTLVVVDDARLAQSPEGQARMIAALALG
jgi:hypothetical protein